MGPYSGVRQLGQSNWFEDDFSSSATATAALTFSARGPEAHFVASVFPRRLSVIAQPPPLSGFVRDLRKGRWRVLRWLSSPSAPEFAAEGPLLALGVPGVDKRMTVSILNLSNTAKHASFKTHVGRLSFASRQRLVVETPSGVTSPGSSQLSGSQVVSLRLYSSRGNYLGNLGSMTEPLISGTHIVTYENGTLSVRRFAGGAPRPVIGFNPPARSLGSFAFRWPDLVVSESTSTPLLPSEVGCWSGSYGPSSPPFLRTFDLARARPFDAPPPTVHVEPAVPPTNCGPAPP